MACSETRCTDNMYVVLDGLSSNLLGCGEHGREIHIKTDVCKGCGNDLRTPVMSILTHFRHENSRATAMFFDKALNIHCDLFPLFVLLVSGTINT